MTAVDGSRTLTPPVSDRDHAQGPGNAHVTLVEYGDYECPYCGRAYPIVKQCRSRWESGCDSSFEIFHCARRTRMRCMRPSPRRRSERTAKTNSGGCTTRCTRHQDALEDEDLAGYAEAIGVPAKEIAHAFAGGTFADRVRTDFRGGIRSGVNGTPTFFVNGERYDGRLDRRQRFSVAPSAVNAKDEEDECDKLGAPKPPPTPRIAATRAASSHIQIERREPGPHDVADRHPVLRRLPLRHPPGARRVGRLDLPDGAGPRDRRHA